MIWHPESKIYLNEIEINHFNVHQIINDYKSNEPWIKELFKFLRGFLNDSDYIEIETSGSTGESKIFTVLKERMVHSAYVSGNYFGLSAGDLALLPLSLTYIAGKMMVVRALTLGLNLRITQPSSNPFLNNNFNEKYDFATFVPLQLATILLNEQTMHQPEKIKQIILGGSGIDFILKEKIGKMTNKVYETFGMAETLSHVAVRKINNYMQPDPPFKALSGIKFSADERSCLIIKSKFLLDNDLITNDVVTLINDETFFWQGRADNVINSGGIKIYPEEIERKLEPLLNGYYCISSMPDERFGNKVILIIETKGQNTFLNINWHKILEAVPKYGRPKEIFLVDELIRNKHGKIVRKQIVEYLISKNIQAFKTL